MKKAIQHGRKDVKPGQSMSNNQSSLTPMPSAGLPMVGDPGEELAHDAVPGAGFAPH